MRSDHDIPILWRFGRLVGLTVRHAVETVVFPYQILRDAAGRVWHQDDADSLDEPDMPPPPLTAAPPRRGRRTAGPVSGTPGAGPRTQPQPRPRPRPLEAIGELEIGTTESAVIEALHDPQPDVRSAAAEAAARARLSSAVFSLILTLDDPEQEVRESAQQAIERITEQEIAFDAGQPAAVRRQMIEDLKGWWKEVRFAQLAEEFGEEVS